MMSHVSLIMGHKAKLLATLALLALVTLIIVGCQNGISAIIASHKPECRPTGLRPLLIPAGEGLPLGSVKITETAISKKILVETVNTKRLQSGDVEVFMRLMNCTDFPLQVEGRTHFFDAVQVDAEPATAWSRVHLPAHTVGSYSVHSIAGKAVAQYLIEIREGK